MFGLKKPLPDEQTERDEERVAVLDGHQQMTHRHQDAADDDRAAPPEEPVGEHPAEVRRHVDQRGVGAVDPVRLPVVHAEEALDEIQRQQRAHPVVREALPHLGEEELKQPRRVAEDGRCRGLLGVGGHERRAPFPPAPTVSSGQR